MFTSIGETLIFCDADDEQLKSLRVILVLFEGVLGLHVNWGKSHLYTINLVPNLGRLLTSVLGDDVGALISVYLGMPLGEKSIKVLRNIEFVLEKCEKLAR